MGDTRGIRQAPGSVGRSWIDLQPPSDQVIDSLTQGMALYNPEATPVSIIRGLIRNATLDAVRRRYGSAEANQGSPSGAFVNPGTTGDIMWQHLDPKTWYLYNQHPGEAQAAPPTTTSTTTTTLPPAEQERAAGDQQNTGMRMIGTARMLTPEEERAKRKDARTGYHELDKTLRMIDRERASGTRTEPGYPEGVVGMLEYLIRQGHIGMGEDWQDTLYNYPGGKLGQRRLDQLIDWYRDRKLYGP